MPVVASQHELCFHNAIQYNCKQFICKPLLWRMFIKIFSLITFKIFCLVLCPNMKHPNISQYSGLNNNVLCVLYGCVLQWTATRARPTPVSTEGAVCRRATAIAATVLRASPGRAARSVSHWERKKKKSTPLRDPKTQRSAAADCWVTVTRGRCVGGGGEKHMLSSAPACVSANEFSRTCGGRRKAEEVFPREFFSPSVCLFVSALNAESGVPVSSTPGCSSPAADKMGICKS